VDTFEESNLFEEDEAWLEDYADPDSSQDDDFQIDEYDLTSTPNDFNVLTIVSFIKSGAVKIPGFQRNYVWDINRASKLIESLILGLPVPQIFLYEEARNKFLVIDGQQRLMSIYYFVSQRFPLKEKRGELRIFLNAMDIYLMKFYTMISTLVISTLASHKNYTGNLINLKG
jgi:uncharacterized protein with ParB-like and HNH nuclease domain